MTFFLPSRTYIKSLQRLSKFDPPVSLQPPKQGNTAADLKLPRGGAVRVCGAVTSQQAPSTLTLMSCLQQGEGAHTHPHTHKPRQWPVKEACQHHSTSVHVLRQLQMWKTGVHVGQNITAANSGASVTEGWGGLAWGNNSPASKDPDTPDTVATGRLLLGVQRHLAAEF